MNFPANPTNGQSYTSGDRTWTYNSSKNAWVGGLNTLTAPVMAGLIDGAAEDISPADGDRLASTNGGVLSWLSLSRVWDYVKTKLDTALTIAGTKSFSGQVQLTGQSATDANSAMTRGLADARLASPHAFTTGSPTTGPWGGNQLVLLPFTTARPDSTAILAANFSSSPPEVKFIPFWVATPRTVSNAVIRITAGTHATNTVRCAIYDVDGNGMPNTRISPQWDFNCSATGVITQAIGASVLLSRGLYWVAFQASAGAATWSPMMTVHGYSEGSAAYAGLNILFGSTLSNFGQYHSGSIPSSSTGTSMPTLASSFPMRSNTTGNQPVPLVGLY